MVNKTYLNRLIDKKIRQYLLAFGAICIEGPTWCDKTMTSLYHSQSSFYVGSPHGNFSNRSLAQMDPTLILEGNTPRLIDEWQEVPSIWDAVRSEVDKRGDTGQCILTGSSHPQTKGIYHSGTGRIGRIRMRTMSLFESGDSTGAISLKNILKDTITPIMSGEVSLKTHREYIIRGGWPGSIGLDFLHASLLPEEYIEAIVSLDIHRVDGKVRELNKIRLLLHSLARNESTSATNKKLMSDIKEYDDRDVSVETVADYLNLFERLFLIDNQEPFSPHVRSSLRVKQSVKRHFADPSIACALLGVSVESLFSDLDTLGFLFEALCERDLKIYA